MPEHDLFLVGRLVGAYSCSPSRQASLQDLEPLPLHIQACVLRASLLGHTCIQHSVL
jgi:hypothetical protein